jgi:hypothetical protein
LIDFLIDSLTAFYTLHRHDFEKVTVKVKNSCALCDESIKPALIGAKSAFQCSRCHLLCHSRHVKEAEAGFPHCTAASDVQNFFFLAEDKAQLVRSPPYLPILTAWGPRTNLRSLLNYLQRHWVCITSNIITRNKQGPATGDAQPGSEMPPLAPRGTAGAKAVGDLDGTDSVDV